MMDQRKLETVALHSNISVWADRSFPVIDRNTNHYRQAYRHILILILFWWLMYTSTGGDVLHIFCRPCFHGEICKTNGCKMVATLKMIKSVHFVLLISPRKHGVQKKSSTPRRSQRKILRNCHLNFFCQAQPKPQFSWAELSYISNFNPPPTHPEKSF